MKKPKWKIKVRTANGFTPYLIIHRLKWKDKLGTPRCETYPMIYISLFGFDIYIEQGNEKEWEQWLWVTEYYDDDYEKAKKEWPWVDWETKKSTWVDYV